MTSFAFFHRNIFSLQDIADPHDLAVSPHGDAVYVAEIGNKSKKYKLHKFEVVNTPNATF
jgi:DNA-binding beta-propeller fold protein YncE